MLTSLYTAVSGMNANGTSLSVIADNIANLNTIGFKGSSVSFGDVLSQSITNAGSASQVGRGVQVTKVTPSFTQGSFETSSSGLDLGIDGDGLFIVNEGGVNFYTRAGQFSLDKSGNIVNPDGLILQGYVADAAGNITGNLGDLQIATRQSPANPSTQVSMSLNLDASAAIPAAAFTLDANGDGIWNDPANFNSSSSTTVYDSQGGAHQVTMYFVKTAANAWTIHYTLEDPSNPGQLMQAGQTSGGAGNPPAGAAVTQNLTFNTDGSLNNDNSATVLAFNFGGGIVMPQNITFNYGTGTGEAPAGNGLDMTTQFASDFAVMNVAQDGYAAGSLQNISVSNNGTITGMFTNGQTRPIGQVALARFIAPTALTKMGRNLYGESFDSGQPVVGTANTSGLGKVLSNSLELSNVDLAEQFVKMIAAQRGFEANSKVITTTDQLMQLLVSLKQ